MELQYIIDNNRYVPVRYGFPTGLTVRNGVVQCGSASDIVA